MVDLEYSMNDSRYVTKALVRSWNNTVATANGNVLKISTFPLIKNRTARTKEHIQECIRLAIVKFLSENRMPNIGTKAVVVLVSKSINEASMNDNDNVEFSATINTLRSFFLDDDDPTRLSVFRMGELANAPGTDIYLMPQEEFPDWFRGYTSPRIRQNTEEIWLKIQYNFLN